MDNIAHRYPFTTHFDVLANKILRSMTTWKHCEHIPNIMGGWHEIFCTKVLVEIYMDNFSRASLWSTPGARLDANDRLQRINDYLETL